MSNVKDAILQFKGKHGSNGLPADPLLRTLAVITDTDDFYQQSLSHTVFRQRMDFVEQEASRFFNASDIACMHPSPLDNGGESLVLDCHNDHILKIRRGKPYAFQEAENVLQPVQSGYSQTLDVTYDIFPQVQKRGGRLDQIVAFVMKAAMNGVIIHDPMPMNFGYIMKAKDAAEKMVLIDYGAFRRGKSVASDMLHASYYLARSLGQPIYQSMPFLHEPWRNFRDNVKSMLGYPKADDAAVMQNHALGKFQP